MMEGFGDLVESMYQVTAVAPTLDADVSKDLPLVFLGAALVPVTSSCSCS